MTYSSLNFEYLRVLEKYLFSYKWCRSDVEKQIFNQSQKGTIPNNMEIVTQKGDEKVVLKKDSVRSSCSRLSTRLYSLLGQDCIEALLYNADDKENADRLKELIAVCIRLNDNYNFQSNFSSVMQELILRKVKECRDVAVQRQFKISDVNQDVLRFFVTYSNDSIFKSLNSLDAKSVALIYKILSRPEYYLQRAEVLSYFDKIVGAETYGVSNELEALRQELVEKEDEINSLSSELIDLGVENTKNKNLVSALKEKCKVSDSDKTTAIKEKENIIEDLTTQLESVKNISAELDVKVVKLTVELKEKADEIVSIKELANSKLEHARTRISELEAQVNSLMNLQEVQVMFKTVKSVMKKGN